MKLVKAAKIEIYGRVQGLNFRVSIKQFCDKKKIDGYVINLKDGSVLVFAQGNSKELNELVKWIEGSPGLCKVEKVEKKEVKIDEKVEDFRIRYDEDFISDQVQSFKNLGKKVLKGTLG